MAAMSLTSLASPCAFTTARPTTRRAHARPGMLPVRAAAAAPSMVPDEAKRTTMNLLLAGSVGLPVVAMAIPFFSFFVPVKAAGTGAGLVAKDALGNDVKKSEWLAKHQPGDHSLVQGLKGDATYLIVTSAGDVEKYGLNAVCTHLGCVVPWNAVEKKFICPCHGSQYNAEGFKVRGPAPLSLALAHVDVVEDLVSLTPWTETDFRDGGKPWWS
ncbi:PETC1 [Auxenochlorella protothecoides x Auxenochlorella symbiontica]